MEKIKEIVIIENEKEWRRYMFQKIEGIDERLRFFEVKVYGFSIAVIAVFEFFQKINFKGIIK